MIRMDNIQKKCTRYMDISLFLCPTPIGNLGDITERTLEVLRSVDIIAAEDTRNTLRLLNHFDIHTPLTSYHEHNKYEKAEELTGIMLSGKTVALVTDAGTPGISDPGEVLVKKAINAGLFITSLPGATAFVTAITQAGLPSGRFVFEGFLPSKKAERKRILEDLAAGIRTVILYEAPHHLRETLSQLLEYFGENRRIAVCRELTKVHEEILRMTLADAVEYYKEREPRGEYVLVLEGKTEKDVDLERQKEYEDMTIEDHVAMYEALGNSRKEAMKKAAVDRGVSKREIYNALLT